MRKFFQRIRDVIGQVKIEVRVVFFQQVLGCVTSHHGDGFVLQVSDTVNICYLVAGDDDHRKRR